MSNSYYNHTTYPTPNSPGSSAALRAELSAITDGFDLLPTLTGNGYKVAMVNAAGTALIASSALQALAITSSTINSTVIGGSTPAAGTFTTLVATSGTVGGANIVTTTATQTLTNKTLTAPVISTIVNTGTLTLPTATDTLVGRGTTDTLINKTLSGASNTLSNIANASLTNSSVTIGSTSVALGATAATIAGLTLTTPAIAQILNTGTLTLPTSTDTLVGRATTDTLTNKTISGASNTLSNIGNASLSNSSVTIGSTSVALGATVTTFAGLTSVTSTSFVGALTGNASTVTNGVYTTGSYADPSWITSLAGSKISGNIAGNAANVTGTVAVANGGTSATTAAGARTALLPTFTGNGGKVVAVNAGGTDIEYVTLTGTGTVTSVDVSGGTTGLTTSGGPITTTGTITLAGTLAVGNGGTGQSTYTDGQLLIGNTSGGLTKATITAGSNITITNGNGSISIAATGLASGDVVGPASSTDGGIAAFNGTTGKLLKQAAAGTDYVSPTGTETLTNKDLTSGTNTFPTSLATLTGSQALTNKDLTSGTNTFPTSLATLTGTQTLTDKRVNPRVVAGATSGSLTINGDATDLYKAEALVGAITFLTPSGTPVDGQKLVIRIEDNGVARGITWTTTSGAFRAVGVTLPTTTTASKVTYVGCLYNSTDIFWDVVAVATQA